MANTTSQVRLRYILEPREVYGKIQMQEAVIEQLIKLESDIRYQEYSTSSEPEYLHAFGGLPILISAPHGAVHTRNGDKEEDEYTAGLARLIGSRTGAHVIYARRKSRTDPNADFTAPYKESLQQIVLDNKINFVLDLHGANEKRDFGVAIGTMHGKSCSEREKQIIIGALEKHSISKAGNSISRLDIDTQLPAEGDKNREPITSFCHRNYIHAAQLEINAKLRIPIRRNDATRHDIPFPGDQGLINNLIEALTDVITSLAES
jgi:hypothetical protein